MYTFLDKLTSYNIFNFLLPGILFVVLLENFTSYSFIQEDVLIGAFVYYFIGLIISRLGSLLLEPLLIKLRFLRFAKRENYIAAAKKDKKLDILSQENNMYRTFSSVIIVLMLFKLYELLSIQFQFTYGNTNIIIIILLLLFLLSYRKQTKYIMSKVKANTEDV